MAQAADMALERSGNPYVGPRPFEEGEKIYGREQDCDELLGLLLSERIVVLHSPSGAGKSSLINAALIPELKRRKRFSPQPPLTVGRPEIAGSPANVAARIRAYVRRESSQTCAERLVSRWNMKLPPSLRLPDPKLRGLTLAQMYNHAIASQGVQFPVLVFDQFEDAFAGQSDDPEDLPILFAQLGELLENRGLWALFAMREDYLGHLEPYRDAVSGCLRTRYRLGLLEAAGAIEAARGPAEARGVSFDEPLAAELVRRLRATVPTQGGRAREGRFVEPVLLQVVCTALWDRKPENASEITAGLIPDEEKINDAIGEFYAGVVRRVVEKTGVPEARLREWCGCELIQNDARAQTRNGPHRNEGDGAVLAELENAYLIRPDTRGEITWYELVHDRMVDAIIENNQRWQLQLPEDQRLLKAAAEQWRRKGESGYFLLRGRSVGEAEKWAAENPGALSDLERRFLQRSREHRDQAKRFNTLTAVMIAICVLAIVAVFVAVRQRERAKLDRQLAEEVTLAAERHRLEAAAAITKAEAVSRRAAEEAAAAAAARADVTAAEARAEAHAARAAEAAEAAKEMRSRAEQLQAEVQHRDGQLRQAKGEFDRFAAATNARLDKQEEELRRKTEEAEANFKDFTSLREGVRVRLRTVEAEARVTERTRKDTLDVVAQLRRLLRDHLTVEPYSLSQLAQLLQSSLNVRTLSYHSTGHTLTTAGAGLVITTGDGAVRLPSRAGAKPEERFFRLCEDKGGHQLVASAKADHSCAGVAWPTSIAAAPGGEDFLVAFPNGRMYLWNWAKGTHVEIPAHRHPVVELSIRDDGKYAISASALWSFAVASLEGEPRRLYRRPNILKWVDITLRGGGTELVRSVAFLGKEGDLIAVGFDDGRVELWSSNRHKRWARVHDHRNSVLSLASDASGKRLVSTSRDGSVVLWRVPKQQDKPALVRFASYRGGMLPEVSSSAYEPSGSMVALGTANGNISVLSDSAKPYELAYIPAHRGRVNSLRFIDAHTLASTGDDNATRVWRIASEPAMREMLHVGRRLSVVSRRYPEPGKVSEVDAREISGLLDQAEALLKSL